MDKLDFKSIALITNEVFTWLVEFNMFKGVGNSLPVEASLGLDCEKNVTSGVEQSEWSRIVLNVGRMVQIESTSLRAGFGETNR